MLVCTLGLCTGADKHAHLGQLSCMSSVLSQPLYRLRLGLILLILTQFGASDSKDEADTKCEICTINSLLLYC